MGAWAIRPRRVVTAIPAALVAAVVLLVAPSAWAGSSTNPDDQIYLTYSGQLQRQAWLGQGGTGQPFGKLDVTLDWQATAHFPNQQSFGAGVVINYQLLNGTISLDDSGDPTPLTGNGYHESGLRSCNATLSQRFTTYRQTATTVYDLVSRRYKMNLYQPPLTAYLLQSTDTSGDYCTVDPAVSSAVGDAQSVATADEQRRLQQRVERVRHLPWRPRAVGLDVRRHVHGEPE